MAVAVLGAAVGVLLPRVALRGAAASRVRPRHGLSARSGQAAATAALPVVPAVQELSLDDLPGAEGASPVEAPAAPTVALADAGLAHDAGRRAVHHTPTVARPAMLTRRGGRWQLDVREVQRPRQVFSGVRLVPTGGQGARDGYRVAAGDRLGLLQAAGIRPGDVLVAVNGLPVRNPDDALEIYVRSRGQRHFDLQFHRDGRSFTVPVDVLQRAQTADAR